MAARTAVVGHRARRRAVANAVRSGLQRWFRTLCGPLLKYLPTHRHAVVYGWPDDEGNAVETVRALGRRYRGTVYWLLADPAGRGPYYAADELGESRRIVKVRKSSLRAYLLSLTAETTFYTHGLFNAVDPPDNRLVVNLWHGDGPKLAKETHLFRSTVVVAGTALWGAQRTQRFGLPPERVAVVGNPRIDQLTAADPAEVLQRLGLDPARRTILWLPTFRTGFEKGRSWPDADVLSGNTDVVHLVTALSTAAREHSIQVVVKPHPLDADDYGDFDVTILPHHRLLEAGVPFYTLLGAADAIISDVSSVWVDFLALDRPIGFYIPDLEELQSGRGLNVEDLAALLPGPRIESPLDAVRFVADVATRGDDLRPSGYPGWSRIGIVRGERAADRLLDWLDDFQRARHRDAFFTR